MPRDVLRLPIRIRIVEICTERERISPSEMVDEGLLADIDSLASMTRSRKLSNVGYHCNRLREFGFLELLDVKPVRGAQQHFYSATAPALFEGEEWEAMDEDQRQTLTEVAWRRLGAQVDDSLGQRVFNARTDRWFAWEPIDLDEQGWDELMDGISQWFRDVERMKQEAETRLTKSGEEPMRVTYALMGFESPKPVRKRPNVRPRGKPHW